jgi:hypothetical protein
VAVVVGGGAGEGRAVGGTEAFAPEGADAGGDGEEAEGPRAGGGGVEGAGEVERGGSA